MKNIDFARHDTDLYPVLAQASDDEKAFLAEILAAKSTSRLSKSERDPLKLAIELQIMGGDSLMNLLRRRGVSYRQIVIDVASKLNIQSDKHDDIMKIEERIAEKVIADYKQKLSDTQRTEFEALLRESLNEQKLRLGIKSAAARGAGGMMPALMAVGGFMLKRGAVNAIPVAGQFLGLLTGVMGIIFAFTGTAYRVTIPAVLIIGTIRARLMTEQYSAEIDL